MATEYLRPNAAGAYTGITTQYPGSGSHYDKVDDVAPDGWSTYVSTTSATYQVDTYNVPSPSGAGTINWIKVWICCSDYVGAGLKAKTAILTDGSLYYGSEVSLTNAWVSHYTQYATNPKTGNPWQWSELEDVQPGIALQGNGMFEAQCTQVYVEVDYTESAPQEIYPTTIPSAEAVGQPQLNLSIKPVTIESQETVGSPTITVAGVFIYPVTVPSAEAVGMPALLYPQSIVPATIPSAEVVGIPSIGFIGIISPLTIPSQEAVGVPTMLKYVWHVILDGNYITETPETNRTFVIGRDDYGNPVWGEAHDSDESALVGERLDFQQELAIPTSAQAESVASAILSKMRLTKARGVILIPPNCGQELFDVVQITDSGANQPAVKFRVVGIRFEYQPRQARYQHKLILGAP